MDIVTMGNQGDLGKKEAPSSWSKRYGQKHRLVWIKEFPPGVTGPRKVRVYQRSTHFVLQWWDKAEKRNLSERVDGDLVAAIARARQIDERLEHFRSSGGGVPKRQHAVLVERFQADLRRRADAGEIDPRTVRRYDSALKHYEKFVEQPSIRRQFPHASLVDRQFALELMAHLRALQVHPNGHPHGQTRPMRRPDYVLDVVRAMYDWAADPHCGKLIPDGFRNPFLRRGRHASAPVAVSIGEPDITRDMAVEFLEACDRYQLRLFGPVVLYGLRASEPCMLFREHIRGDWLDVPCLPDLAYFTKGRREKCLPLIPCIYGLLDTAAGTRPSGLLYLRRAVLGTNKVAPLAGAPLESLVAEFQRRCTTSGIRAAADRQRVRNQLLREAGAMNYDHTVTEFKRITRLLGWPRSATIKDFRHLFATCLENAGMPEHYRQFLMGQSSGRSAIVTYTHLNEVHARFRDAVEKTLYPLAEVIERQAERLGFDDPAS